MVLSSSLKVGLKYPVPVRVIWLKAIEMDSGQPRQMGCMESFWGSQRIKKKLDF
jgi:hypothetical protein